MSKLIKNRKALSIKSIQSTLEENIATQFCKALERFQPPSYNPIAEDIMRVMMVFNARRGQWEYYNLDLCGYMAEPLNELHSYKYTSTIFMGPARTGKSEALLKGFGAYCVGVSKKDLLVVHLTHAKAIEWSKLDFIPVLRYSPLLQKQLPDNPYDLTNQNMRFRSLNTVRVVSPSVKTLASITVQFVIITDYDRHEAGLGGEGDVFTLASKRTSTYGSQAMTIAESSPGFPVLDPEERPTGHSSPKALGIASLYNEGTKKALYVKCKSCGNWWWAGPEHINWDKTSPNLSLNERAATARVECPDCGEHHSTADVHELWCKYGTKHAMWVGEGQYIENDQLKGDPIDTSVNSYWLRAPVCGLTTLQEIVSKLIKAENVYNNTGSEEQLKAVVNTDLGIPYIPKTRSLSESLEFNRFRGKLPSNLLPHNSRALVAVVDVQAGYNARFVVNLFAILDNNVVYLARSYEIKHYNNKPIRPEINPEDWDVLKPYVFNYRCLVENLNGDPEYVLGVSKVLIDSGGFANTTTNAELFRNKLKRTNLGNILQLVKGTHVPDHSNQGTPYTSKVSNNLLLVNTFFTKDMVVNRLDKSRVPGDRLTFQCSCDIQDKTLKELEAEYKDPNTNQWQKRSDKRPNELFDAFSYLLGYLDNVKFVNNLVEGELPVSTNINPLFRPLAYNNPFAFKCNEVDFNANKYVEENSKTRTDEIAFNNAMVSNNRRKKKAIKYKKGGFNLI